ncbi:hypothetical protein QQP08_013959 [Theobroma cacao]|nr:hypothetical protein QQP08_013959 [Theobroma cacao]
MKKVRDQKRSDSSEESVVPLLIEISFSFLGNGTAMMGRWYIPRDSFLRLVVGAVGEEICSSLKWSKLSSNNLSYNS